MQRLLKMIPKGLFKMMELKVGAFESRKRYDIETYKEQLLEEI